MSDYWSLVLAGALWGMRDWIPTIIAFYSCNSPYNSLPHSQLSRRELRFS